MLATGFVSQSKWARGQKRGFMCFYTYLTRWRWRWTHVTQVLWVSQRHQSSYTQNVFSRRCQHQNAQVQIYVLKVNCGKFANSLFSVVWHANDYATCHFGTVVAMELVCPFPGLDAWCGWGHLNRLILLAISFAFSEPILLIAKYFG